MAMATLDGFTRKHKFFSEQAILDHLIEQSDLSKDVRARISGKAAELVRRIRADSKSGLMENFLAEYGLSTKEGVALMCLAEAMLRVPDSETIEALIEDKIAPSDWGKHLGKASSSLVNASTWALMLTGKVLVEDQPGIAGTLRAAIKRLGEPVIRVAVGHAMKEMGRQFVLGETITAALERAKLMENKGYSYSYDMLGEAAMTRVDATSYAEAYSDAISSIGTACTNGSVEDNPGISIKLSALHPRYEVSQEDRVIEELVPIVLNLAKKAKAAGMGLNIDAEEQDRLVLSLKVIEAVLSDSGLAGWDGFGVVVQAYGKRAGAVLDWLHALAVRLDRKVMVRLVKGAYWDTEMKLAQVEGLEGFTLFTSKAATDVSYIANAKKLFDYSDRIYPQFATHNAHTVAAVLELAQGRKFEFQRLHGMGDQLHDIVLNASNARCRIYAPVGKHRDLLAYLVRRLLENGANSSFVNQIVDESVAPEEIAIDPFEAVKTAKPPSGLVAPNRIFGNRENSKGFDLTDEDTLREIEQARDIVLPDAAPLTVRPASGTEKPILNPTNGEEIAKVLEADEKTAVRAIEDARPWDVDVQERAKVLRNAADLYEKHFGLLFATLAKEAGKTLLDSVGEFREAVDFLRYYADEAEKRELNPRGVFAAISPWNFPLAIFTGQISAALAAGNGVIAKPAEPTPIIATLAVGLLHEAGVPKSALQLLPGRGSVVGNAITSDPRISGVVFTGSTETAQKIRKVMAEKLDPSAPLIAETGGLNAMIVDSTALPEQAVRDIVASSFQSAGQRCSALRCLYVQEDVADGFMSMLQGAMDELVIGDPWHLHTDVGPVINGAACKDISGYIAKAAAAGKVAHQLSSPSEQFVPPTLISVSGIEELEREIFGPVLHVATFRNTDTNKVVDAINKKQFGLTFGLHTRIDSRVQEITDRIHVGNVYVNRNQIGAIVGSQPFGGEGLSGTGPKAGGPTYLLRFARPMDRTASEPWKQPFDVNKLQGMIDLRPGGAKISETAFPGPTGESNTLSLVGRGPILCMGPGNPAMMVQATRVRDLGGEPIMVEGDIPPEALSQLQGIQGAIWWGDNAQAYARALAEREGPILPLIVEMPDQGHVAHERHVCVDTTASGGNAVLLAG